MAKKLLILSASYWSWHNSAAQALNNYFQSKWYQIEIVDLVQFLQKNLWKTTQKFYKDIWSEYETIWQLSFSISSSKVAKSILSGIDFLWKTKFNKLMKDVNPDIIISVFPYWQILIKNYLENNNNISTWTVITDANVIHSLWYVENDKKQYINNYFVTDDQTKETFIEIFEHKTDNVIVSGFPIEEKYIINKSQIGNKNILIILTQLDVKFITILLTKFLNTEFNIKIVQWREEKNFTKLSKQFSKIKNFKFYDYLDIKAELKNIDIFIWKSGGAITNECVATDTPMIVPYIIPWQEKWNLMMLENYEIWFFEGNPDKILFLLKYINRNNILPNFKKVKVSQSCKIIYDTLTTK